MSNNLHGVDMVQVDTEQIIETLGVRPLMDKEYKQLTDSLTQHYHIKQGSIYFHNPAIYLFTPYMKYEKSLNHADRVVSLVKKKDRIDCIGFFYKAKIRTPNRGYYHTELFAKEIPILPVHKAHLYYKRGNLTPAKEQMLYNFIYHNNSAVTTEIMCSYLASRLRELNISPHFCKMYGCVRMTLDRFTYDITSDSEFKEKSYVRDFIEENEPYCEFVTRRSKLFLEYRDFPCYLLMCEKADTDIDMLYDIGKLEEMHFNSIVFQIYAAIFSAVSIFGLKHNDLHLSNVMLSRTKQKYLYYYYKGDYFRIPTFGYIVRIIDWGRGTYEFDGNHGYNHIFTQEYDCFEQYRYKRMNHSGKDNVLPSRQKWTDIVMITHNILNAWKEFRNTELGKSMMKWIENKDGVALDVEEFNWDIYCQVTNNTFNVQPHHILQNRSFRQFIIKYADIPDGSTVYPLHFGGTRERDNGTTRNIKK